MAASADISPLGRAGARTRGLVLALALLAAGPAAAQRRDAEPATTPAAAATAPVAPAPAPLRDDPLPWLRQDTDTRLFVLLDEHEAQPHALLVHLPDAVHAQAQGVVALNARGEPVPCVPLLADGRLVAVELRLSAADLAQARAGLAPPSVAVAGGKANLVRFSILARAIQLYLLPAPVTLPPAPPLPPVLVSTRSVRLIARPVTCAEYTRFARTNPLLGREQERALPALPEFFTAFMEDVSEARQLRYELTTTLLCPVAGEYRFRLRNPGGSAWFLFLDQQPLTSWGEARLDGDGFLHAPPITLAAGPRALRLAGIAGAGEGPPLVSWRPPGAGTDFQPLLPTVFASPRSARGLAWQRRGAPLAPGYRFRDQRCYAFDGTDTLLALAQFTDLTRCFDRAELTGAELLTDAARFHSEDDALLAFLPGPALLPFRWVGLDDAGRRAEIPGCFRADWPDARLLAVPFRLRQLPVFLPAEGPLRLPYEVSLPDALENRVLDRIRLRQRAYDRAGKVLSEELSEIPASPFERELRLPVPEPAVARLELAPVLGGLPLSPPLAVHFLAPGDSLGPCRGGVDRLRYGAGFAILRRPTPPGGPARPARVVKLTRLLLVDDLIAAEPHYGDDLEPTTWFQGHSGAALRHVPLGGRRLAGEWPLLRKFLAFEPLATAADADAIVWAVGREEWLAGLDLRDYRAHLSFLVEATLARGKLPILANLPAGAAFPREQVRPYALAVKELGVAYGVPVLDYYSAALRHRQVDRFYRLASDAPVFSATPNAEGRRWFLQPLVDLVAAMNETWEETH